MISIQEFQNRRNSAGFQGIHGRNLCVPGVPAVEENHRRVLITTESDFQSLPRLLLEL